MKGGSKELLLPADVKVWAYRLPGGHRILAGKTDRDNDRLTLKVAAPHHWWFHVRGMPGSHVVLVPAHGSTPDRALLKTAAAVAAYHSKARSGGVVAVSATRARYVAKRRGAKPGSVFIRKERVFSVRPALPSPSPNATKDSSTDGDGCR